MSEKENVNINDRTSKKFSADKKICISLDAAETETSRSGSNEAPAQTEGTDLEKTRSASTNNLNKESAPVDVNKNTSKLSKEVAEKDTKKSQDDQDEKSASEEGTSTVTVYSAGSSKPKTCDEGYEKVVRQVVAASNDAESVGTESGGPEVKTDVAGESLEKLKMNIEMEASTSLSQSQAGISPSQKLQDGDQNEPDTDVGAEDKTKENVSGKKEDLSEETNDQDSAQTEEPIEIDQPRDDSEGKTYQNEGAKSDSENEVTDTDYPMESATEDSQPGNADKESNIDRNTDTVTSVSEAATGSRQKDKDNESLEACASAGDATRSKTKRNTEEEHNVRPSDFVMSPLARLKQQWSSLDTQTYRAGYPGKSDDPRLAPLNLHFYQGRIRSRPDGDYIDDIHNNWWNEYDLLEVHHGYIQWLFPIRENGMNRYAQELQLCEAEAIKADEMAMERFIKSYKMMLNFYGIRMVNDETGEVERADNWHERFDHLNFSMHNYLRITRILKCLGELGLERFKAPFLRFVLEEAISTGELRNTLASCISYWVGTVKDDVERESILDFAENLHRTEEELRKE